MKSAVPRLFREVLLVFIGAFALLLVIGILTVRSINASKRANAKAHHSAEVRAGLDDELSLLRDIEANALGYALTGQRAMLGDLDGATRGFEESLAKLQSLPHDDPQQVRRFDILRDRAHRVVRNASRWVGAAEKHADQAERVRILTDGRALIDQTRAMISTLSAHEASVEAEHLETSRRITDIAYRAVYASLIIGLVLLTSSAVLLRRELSARERIEALKTEVIGMASHDLRTPLTIIQGSLRFVLAEDHPLVEPGSRPILELALRNSRHMLAVIDNYLDLAALESGRTAVAAETVDLKHLMEDAVESMRHYEASRGLRYSLKTPPGPLAARGDASRLREVIDNLLSNAAKFSPDGAEIEIDLTIHEGRVCLSVRDHGPGIRPEFAGKVFKRFARDAVPAGRSRGTGLGLSIAKTLVERMDGTIRFETKENGGTTFIVELQAAAEGEKNAVQA